MTYNTAIISWGTREPGHEVQHSCANCGCTMEGEGINLRCPGCAECREERRTLRAELEQAEAERDVLATTIETMVKMLYMAGLEWTTAYVGMDKQYILEYAAQEAAKAGEKA